MSAVRTVPVATASGRRAALAFALLGLWLLLGGSVTAHDPSVPHWEAAYRPPGVTGGFWFGTDPIGRDLYARTLAGARISLAIGLIAAGGGLVLGVLLGALSGLLGGAVDWLVQRTMLVLNSLPFLLLVVLLLAVLPPSAVLVILAIAAYVWIDVARMVRARVLQLRERAFLQAARVLGFGTARQFVVHLLPQLWPTAFQSLLLALPQAVLMESFLAFLGLSPLEATGSLGGLLTEGVQELEPAPWLLLVPGAVLAAMLYAMQEAAEALRHHTQPA